MNKRIYLSPPHMSGEELSLVKEAFDQNWVAPAGPQIDAFEEELAAYNGIPFCTALSSGTAAIHLALVVLGAGPGDEVICSSFTFSASCNPIRYVGATPVFVDSEKDTWNMDPELLKEAIQDRTSTGKTIKAIIVVHGYGAAAQINSIMEIAKANGIPVIEDAAEALGTTISGKKLGTFGDIGIYSFNGNKIITTSSGGALVSENEAWAKEAHYLSNQAYERIPHYENRKVGYTYRLSNICASIGLGQLKVLDQRVQQRRSIFDFYHDALKEFDALSFQPELPGSQSNRWLTCIQVDPSKGNGATREDIRVALEERNIESRPLWKPMHLQPVFKDCPYYGGKVSEELFEKGLCLPSGSAMSVKELGEVVRIVGGCLEVDGFS